MAEQVPSLSAKGWLADPKAKADRLMAYYMTSNYSQTNLFRGEIVSLPKQIQQYGKSATDLRDYIQSDVERLFGAYFDSVSCEVTTDRPDPEDEGRLNITVSAFLTQDGQTYSLGRLIEVNNNIVNRIMDINNTGATK